MNGGNGENMSKNIDKKQIISAAAALIKEKNGSRNMTIRDIAGRLGCSHPNIYNYYHSVDEMLWDVLEVVLLTMIDTVMSKVDMESSGEQKLEVFIYELITFYLNNPGWYSLVWFDELNGKMPAKTKKIIIAPRAKFCEFLGEVYPDVRDIEIFNGIGDVVHNYIHGQMARYINGRGFINDSYELRDLIVATVSQLIKIIISGKHILPSARYIKK